MAGEAEREDVTQSIESAREEVTQRIDSGRKTAARTRTRVPDHEIAEVRDVDFPVAMRGYDRAAVDAYVSRVNRLLAELQITAAPESAIRHALDEVADETRGILERAHETGEEITRRSRAQADDRLQRAEREAEDVRSSADTYVAEIRGVAERQLQALQADADSVSREREAVLTNLRELAQRLEQIAAEATERYPTRPEIDTRVTPAPSAPAASPPASPVDDEDADEPHPFADH
jgi:DivIVA domain-containing protein